MTRSQSIQKIHRLLSQVAGILHDLEHIPNVFEGPNRIAHYVSELYKVHTDQMFSKRRDALTVEARYVAMWLIWRVFKLSGCGIARMFRRDHGTVLHGRKYITARIETEPKFAAKLESLERELSEENKPTE